MAYLLQLPAARATVDTVGLVGFTALSIVSCRGEIPSVQLMLDAGADPTIPAGDRLSLNRALSQGHAATVAILRRAIAEPDRARALHKARGLLDAAIVINKAEQDARDKGDAPAVQRQKAIAAVPVYLKDRVQEDEALPVLELVPQQADGQLRATVAFVLGLEEGGVEYAGL